MSEDPKNANGNLPPKLTLRKEESGAIPPAAAMPPPVKKATQRIPLTAVDSGIPADASTPPVNYSTKTIRLTPLAASRPLSVAPAVRPPSATTSLSDLAKRQTSRIPLEAAMAAEQAAAGTTASSDAPKTIRIKRPGQPPAPIVATPRTAAPAAQPAEAAGDVSAQKAKTSRVDLSELQSDEGAQATQRKTIKIRRADGATAKPAPRSIAVSRLEPETTAAGADEAQTVRVGVVFPIMAAAALLLLGVLMVVLAAQAFPNLGWTLPGAVSL